MSDEGRNYVKAYSPFTGTTFWVHYVLGDLANWQHGYEVFVGNKRLTEEWPFSLRAVERAMTDLIDGGYLVVVTRPAPGRPVRYRFEFKGADHLARQSGARTDFGARQPGANVRQPGARTPAKTEIAPITNRNINKKGTELAEDLASSAPAQGPTDGEHSPSGKTRPPVAKGEVAKGELGKPRARDALFDAMAECCGYDLAQLTKSGARMIGTATSDIRNLHATPAQVWDKARIYKELHPTWELTPMSLVVHGHVEVSTLGQKKSPLLGLPF